MVAWTPAWKRHPGFYLLGSDGSRDMYCVDLDDQQHCVRLTNIVSSGWHDAEELGLTVDQFICALDDGTFDGPPA